MGRPSKVNRAVAGRVIAATRNGATREAAAAAGPIARSTLYQWIKAGRLDPDTPEGRFVAQLDDADDACELAAIEAWRSHFATDWRAVAEFLARHPSTRERWRRQPAAVEVTGPDGGDVVISIEERRAALAEKLTRWRREQGLDPPLDEVLVPLDPYKRAEDRRHVTNGRA